MLQGGQLTVVRRLVGDRHEDPVGLREDALHAAQDAVGVEDDGIVVDRCAQRLDKLWKLRIPQRRDILRGTDRRDEVHAVDTRDHRAQPLGIQPLLLVEVERIAEGAASALHRGVGPCRDLLETDVECPHILLQRFRETLGEAGLPGTSDRTVHEVQPGESLPILRLRLLRELVA